MHLNGDVLMGVDIRVGGNDPFNSDLLEVCFMPFNHSYRPHGEFAPFNLCFRPDFPVDMDIANLSRDRLAEQFTSATQDAITGAELFGHWWKSFRLKPGCQINLVCWDWASKKTWIENWLGAEYQELISPKYRDLMTLVHFLNDRDDYRGDAPPYPIQTFAALLGYSGIKLLQRNSLMSNCKALSDAYRHMIHQR